LLAGDRPCRASAEATAARHQALLAAGIRRLICLLEPHEMAEGPGGTPAGSRAGSPGSYDEQAWRAAGQAAGLAVAWESFPIPDFGVPSEAHLEAILDAIDAALARGEGVYVHCWGGIGRTGTVVGAWLAHHGRAGGEEALTKLADLRRATATAAFPSPETEAQRALVRRWPPRPSVRPPADKDEERGQRPR
jgi:hypothetical protein